MKFIILLFLFLSSVLLCKFTCGKIKNQIKRNALKHNINYYESNYNHKLFVNKLELIINKFLGIF